MRIRVSVARFVVLSLLSPVAFASSPVNNTSLRFSLARTVAGRDWSIGAARSLAQSPPSRDAIEAFVTLHSHTVWNTAIDKGSAQLCEAGFFDLAGDGKYRLVVSMDYSGRRLCNDIDIVGQNGDVQNFNGWLIETPAGLRHLVREDSSGRKILVVDEPWSLMGGLSDCAATWTHIYAWDGRRITDVSAAHPQIYRQRLAQLNTQIAGIRAGDDHAALESSCAIMERDRIVRSLGGPAITGLSLAEQWMSDADPGLRALAAASLGKIDLPRARHDLATLAADKVDYVALAAKMNLRK
jgi:hypothetical protein